MANKSKPKADDNDESGGERKAINEKRAKGIVGRLENLIDEIKSEQGAYRARVKNIKQDIEGIYERAEKEGMPRAAVKAVIEKRALEAKLNGVREDLEDIDLKAKFDEILRALGDLGTTPLGKAAAKAEATKSEAADEQPSAVH